ncbi:hypothetical protein L1987_25489 [Smallanthus sonchifolius]|uniref:Uncharacterized protein n=1 Tax=Smallanthus sonchifolius TaxID=185202 RepID=A0ACB9IN55_9ASTR|nr:hypothetical protein L1987_25489 [Smallanthus sonchifolius]
MCSKPDQLTSKTPSSSLLKEMNDSMKIVEPVISFPNLLELAANNDVNGFKQLINRTSSSINEVGLWYVRQRSSRRMLMEHRTPLMIAATYGSLDVVKFILSLSKANVNSSCGQHKTTALHCAASSGSPNAYDVIKILLVSGADPETVDVDGRRAIFVVFVPPNLLGLKTAIERLLQNQHDFGLTFLKSNLDGVKSDMYMSDEFRMFVFKISPCSRAYSHDWTECPFVHPGENARRRDPRKIHYSCVPCPDFKKGHCGFGDLCEFAHGVFECWLHPAQYRTQLCKDGTFCNRRVCFFAHTHEELRPLYVSTGSAMSPPPPPFSPPPLMQLQSGNLLEQELKLVLDLEIWRRQQAAVLLPSHRQAALNQFFPINPYSPKGFYGISSPRIVSPRGIEQFQLTPLSPHLSKQDFVKGNVDWSVNGGEAVWTRKLQCAEPDVSWVQSLVKEPPPLAPNGLEMEPPGTEKDHAALGTWLENMQLDQIVA